MRYLDPLISVGVQGFCFLWISVLPALRGVTAVKRILWMNHLWSKMKEEGQNYTHFIYPSLDPLVSYRILVFSEHRSEGKELGMEALAPG